MIWTNLLSIIHTPKLPNPSYIEGPMPFRSVLPSVTPKFETQESTDNTIHFAEKYTLNANRKQSSADRPHVIERRSSKIRPSVLYLNSLPTMPLAMFPASPVVENAVPAMLDA